MPAQKHMIMAGKNFVLSLVFVNFFFVQTHAQDSTRVFLPEISYTGDLFNNLTGGIQTGIGYLGMVNLKLTTHPWKGGNLFINVANTHGAEPSADYLGDYQVASNIEAGEHTYLQELWFRQVWEKVEVTIGLQDLNVDLVNTNYGTLFSNSSFGVLPTVSGNIPAPIFPLTSLGISTRWQLSKKISVHAAVYDGAPTDFEDNPYNLRWQLSKDDGFLLFTELQHEIVIKSLPGRLKAGVYLHQHLNKANDHIGRRDSVYRNNHGYYLMGEQEIWNGAAHKSLGLFIQLGFSPKRVNYNYYYAGAGVNYTGLLSRECRDVAGLAVAHDGLRGGAGKETAIELTYRFPLFRFLFLQPDIQYIINPAGTSEHLENCLAATLRFEVVFK
jgi:porin